MALHKDGQNLFIFKGDTGQVTFKGLPTDKNYSVYKSIYNPDTAVIIKEIQATYTQASGTAVVQIDESTSNDLPVGEWEWALKICAGGSEDTLIPRVYTDSEGNLIKEPAPKFTVDNKYVEGE